MEENKDYIEIEDDNVTSNKNQKGKKIIRGIIGIFLIYVIVASCYTIFRELSSPSENTQRYINVEPVKVTWYELMRSPEKYKGDVVIVTGQVFQVEKVWGDKYVALIFTKKEPYVGYYDNIVWVNYNEKETTRVLENDIIQVKGVFKGLKEYTTVLGATNTVPEIDAIEIEIITPAEKSS